MSIFCLAVLFVLIVGVSLIQVDEALATKHPEWERTLVSKLMMSAGYALVALAAITTITAVILTFMGAAGA